MKISEMKDPNNRLHYLGLKHHTDKAWHHEYTYFYHDLLKGLLLNGRPIKRMMEVGILHGSSLKMWRDYFPMTTIYGVDISFNTPVAGCKIIQADMGNPAEASKFIPLTNALDFIIDDGGHTMQQQQVTFSLLWDCLKPGGVYVIEDIHTSRLPKYRHIHDALTTEAWVKNGFKGSNYCPNIVPDEVEKVTWWHREGAPEDDSRLVAIFKAKL